jgi:hypothetical protein
MSNTRVAALDEDRRASRRSQRERRREPRDARKARLHRSPGNDAYHSNAQQTRQPGNGVVDARRQARTVFVNRRTGRATFTTVPSTNVMVEPIIAAIKTAGPGARTVSGMFDRAEVVRLVFVEIP